MGLFSGNSGAMGKDLAAGAEAIAAANGGAVNDTTGSGRRSQAAHRDDRATKRGKGKLGNYRKVAADRDRDTKGTGLVGNGGFGATGQTSGSDGIGL